jgi:hypothetical protein
MISPQAGVDFGAVSEIIGNHAVNLLKRKGVIVVGDALLRNSGLRCAWN